MSLAVLDAAQPDLTTSIIEAGRLAAARGWVPATSGNFSARRHGRVAITASGVDKGTLAPEDILQFSLDSGPPAGASAETGLHLALYRRDQAIGAVVHIHSINATVVSKRHADSGEILIEGYELLKAFAGIRSHATRVSVPIFANSQNIDTLADAIDRHLATRAPSGPNAPGYLLAAHGLYAWGATMREALRHAEAFEFLFGCVLAGERS